jgi:hypothetical protein
VLWSWSGSPDPDFLLSLLTTAQIGKLSDSNYSNPAYDRLFDAQRRAPTVVDRQAIVRQMLDLAYDEAPYLPLFYDDQLDAHRTDRFGGWPAASGGTTPLFTPGVAGYLALGAPAAAEPSATTPPPARTAAPTASLAETPPASDATAWLTPGYATVVLVGALLAVVTLILVLVGSRRRSRRGRGT